MENGMENITTSQETLRRQRQKAAERQKAFRQRQKERGLVEVAVWVPDHARESIRRAAERITDGRGEGAMQRKLQDAREEAQKAAERIESQSKALDLRMDTINELKARVALLEKVPKWIRALFGAR